MRSIFGIIVIVVVAFCCSAKAEEQDDCDAKCQAYKHAQSTEPVPYKEPTICIAYSQLQVDNIVIRFYDANGKELDPSDPLHNRKAAPMHGTICPGVHWFREATRAELCNSTVGRWLEKPTLDTLVQLHGTPEGSFVHLYRPQH